MEHDLVCKKCGKTNSQRQKEQSEDTMTCFFPILLGKKKQCKQKQLKNDKQNDGIHGFHNRSSRLMTFYFDLLIG